MAPEQFGALVASGSFTVVAAAVVAARTGRFVRKATPATVRS